MVFLSSHTSSAINAKFPLAEKELQCGMGLLLSSPLFHVAGREKVYCLYPSFRVNFKELHPCLRIDKAGHSRLKPPQLSPGTPHSMPALQVGTDGH